MVTLPQAGQEDWDVPLNAALKDLQDAIDTHESADDPHGAKLYADATFLPKALITVDDLFSETPFTVAHRGSGGEFPEHTMSAYRSAVAAGAKAIEVSVQCTADGVPVCFHDIGMSRMTGLTGAISVYTWAQLREAVRIKAQPLLGDGWSDQVPTLMREVLDEFLGKVVIFLEAKTSDAIVPVQQTLENTYPQANKSVVWKNYYTSNSFPWARNRHFKTWGYMDSDTTSAELDAVDGDIDYWGVPDGSSDAQIQMVVARGKPVIAWEVHRHCDVARFVDLGCQGLMEAQWLYLNNEPAVTADRFDLKLKVPGTLGIAGYNADYALKYDASGRAYINELPNTAVLMGGFRGAAADTYTVKFSMTLDDLGSQSDLHADVAFCRSTDDPYQFSNANTTHGGYGSPGGYHLVVRRTGNIQLYRHDQGVTSGTKLGDFATENSSVTLTPPTAGTAMDFTIQVTDTQIIVSRTDVASPYVLTVDDTTYRGRYWHLGVGSIVNDAEKPYYTNVSVS